MVSLALVLFILALVGVLFAGYVKRDTLAIAFAVIAVAAVLLGT